jgi:adenylate cyclase
LKSSAHSQTEVTLARSPRPGVVFPKGAKTIQRRLSTILAADVVGYSRLIGLDETGTVQAVKAQLSELIEPKAKQYRGRIVKLMGDGVLMEFVSVVDAILFAVEMQGGAAVRNEGVAEDRQIINRIGINIGDIIVDGEYRRSGRHLLIRGCFQSGQW